MKLKKDNDITTIATINNSEIVIPRKGGRPKGSSTMSVLENKSLKEQAMMKICMLYKCGRDANTGFLKQGDYAQIYDAVMV